MLNQTVLIGRLTEEVKIEKKGDKEFAELLLAVQSQFKDEDGTYGTNFIPIVLWNDLARNVSEYCTKGDLVGIKGYLKDENYTANGKRIISLVAEKVTFLSSKKESEGK